MSTPTALVGTTIRAEMARRAISQATLAKHLGIGQTAVSKRLRGLIPWDINELQAIAELLDVPLSTLLPDTTAPAA